MSETTNHNEALKKAEQSAKTLHKKSIGTTVAVIMFSLASSAALLIFGFGKGPAAIVAGTTFVLASVIALVTVASTAKARSRDFTNRYRIMIAVWAVIYTFFVVAGFALFAPAQGWFWVLGAILIAMPGIWFAFTSRNPGALK